jgi:hypothetical protein
LFGEFHKFEGGYWSVFMRFEDERTTGDKSGGDFADRDCQRKVPSDNADRDSGWLGNDPEMFVGFVGCAEITFDTSIEFRIVPKPAVTEIDFTIGFLERFADFQ